MRKRRLGKREKGRLRGIVLGSGGRSAGSVPDAPFQATDREPLKKFRIKWAGISFSMLCVLIKVFEWNNGTKTKRQPSNKLRHRHRFQKSTF